ncbi:DNA protecting protein DprA [Candidatus Beckwithbacteria bacterium RBG_13_42_9]|uniref:DNA protecting protein DprA n=1 Tax=Candidatus Beckwithbacteria bacterium RBG_13_42_9 TaxID=1797457 RepID=A0A1F5E9B4_9BACT|nr:MAG: DNA protecting protein DprA [Candidatus Beckwithbacteria bacterium RBG_13_42_9]
MELHERDYWLAFSCFPGIGSRRFQVLTKYFGSAKKAWKAKKDIWQKLGLGERIIQDFLFFREQFSFEKEKEKLEKHLISFLTLIDESFPALLKEIADPPFLLYIKGTLLDQDGKALAVVGARKITPYGREVTEKFVSWLAIRGFTIISGLARGVDSVAHRVALGNGGRTVAILGSGLDQVYPPEHKALAQEIIKNGALISEYPLGMPALRQNFPPRNRIISGMSLGILVTEGEIKSGTKITSRYAGEQGREVFAVPGPITSPTSAAPSELIKMGAKLVSSGEDILEELKLGRFDKTNKINNREQSSRNYQPVNFNNPAEKQIWELLLTGSKHIDELVRSAGMAPAEIMSLLTLMEVSGKVKSIGNGMYMAV